MFKETVPHYIYNKKDLNLYIHIHKWKKVIIIIIINTHIHKIKHQNFEYI